MLDNLSKCQPLVPGFVPKAKAPADQVGRTSCLVRLCQACVGCSIPAMHDTGRRLVGRLNAASVHTLRQAQYGSPAIHEGLKNYVVSLTVHNLYSP